MPWNPAGCGQPARNRQGTGETVLPLRASDALPLSYADLRPRPGFEPGQLRISEVTDLFTTGLSAPVCVREGLASRGTFDPGLPHMVERADFQSKYPGVFTT